MATLAGFLSRAAELTGVDVPANVIARPPAVEVHVWRPRDFDELHARLARGRHRTEPVGPC